MVSTKNFSFPHTLIGFDSLWNEVERLSAQNDPSFPKYNVVKHNETEYSIEIALAGYKLEDLEVELKDGVLHVSGDNRDTEGEVEVEYLHKGISSKRFNRSFKLADHVVVDSADFVDGLLIVDLRVELPEEKKPRKIMIGAPEKVLLTEE